MGNLYWLWRQTGLSASPAPVIDSGELPDVPEPQAVLH